MRPGVAAGLALAVAIATFSGTDAARNTNRAAAATPSHGAVAFIDVTVVPLDRERVIADQTVLVQDGRITAIGPAAEVAVPEGALRVDGRGRYLMPGLAEMHGHLPGADAPPELVADVLFLYVAHGVTLVRGMQGHPRQLAIRDSVARGELLGPRLVLAGPGFGGDALTADEARRRVREQQSAGFDLLKIGEGLRPDVYEAIATTAREVAIPFAGHVPDAVGLFRALEVRQATVDHLDNYVEALLPDAARADIPALWGVAQVVDRVEERRIAEVVEATRRAGTAIVPTMVLWEVFFGGRTGDELQRERQEVRYVPPQMRESWIRATNARAAGLPSVAAGRRVIELRRQILRALHDGGAQILMGTDSPQLFSVPGYANYREMELWAEIGMTPYEILRTGTWNVAAHLGELEQAGTVAVGRRADLVLLDANPLDSVRNVRQRAGVMVNGRWLPEMEIHARLEELASRHAGTAVTGP